MVFGQDETNSSTCFSKNYTSEQTPISSKNLSRTPGLSLSSPVTRTKRKRETSTSSVSAIQQVMHNLSDGNLSDNSTQPPLCLDSQYEKIHLTLSKSLLEGKDSKNVALFLMGPRGHGKRLVLNRVLSSLEARSPQPLRVVRLNGLLLRGGDDGLAIREILRQLAPPNVENNRRTAFHSNITTLNDLFHHAKIDSDPLLIILHELDYFAATDSGFNKGKQILLYNLFDRASDHETKLSVVGTMSKLKTVTLFEKRVRSRATGNLCIVDFPHYSYENLVKIMEQKFEPLPELQADVRRLLTVTKRDVFERNYNLGKDIRWFSRVFTLLLSLSSHQNFSPLSHFSDFDITTALTATQALPQTSPRLRALLDLPTPQLTLLLCARRIIKRQCQSSNDDLERAPPPPLTFDRLAREYDHFEKKHSTVVYSREVLEMSLGHLMESDLIKGFKDHTGGGCTQYHLAEGTGGGGGLRRKLGLEVVLELDRELDRVLRADELACPTALKEWGLKTN